MPNVRQSTSEWINGETGDLFTHNCMEAWLSGPGLGLTEQSHLAPPRRHTLARGRVAAERLCHSRCNEVAGIGESLGAAFAVGRSVRAFALGHATCTS